MKRYLAFYFFIFKTRLAKACGWVLLAVALSAGYIGERVKVYALLREIGALEREKSRLEENIEYLDREVKRKSSRAELGPKAEVLGLTYPHSRELARLPLFPMPEEELWQRSPGEQGLWARLSKKFPLKEAVVEAEEFKRGK
jgi:hypothetical protein